MNRRTNADPSEKLPCDIAAGFGKNSHSPITPPAPEEKTVSL